MSPELARCRSAASTVGLLIDRRGRWLIPALLTVVTFVAFLPILGNGFVGDWDDDLTFAKNPAYRGLGWRQLHWMFTTFHLGHYMPLTWLTFGLDYVVWGMNPVGYHLTTLVLHVASTLVFYVLAARLLVTARAAGGDGGAVRLGAAAAAALFAVHPLRVESVAWATERRDVLCGLFYLLAVLAYLRACQGPREERLWRRRWYWAAVTLGALALLSKSMAVSLPVVLLVLDVYPLRRLGGTWAGWFGPGARRVWADKVPFVVMSEAASGIALLALKHVMGMKPFAQFGLVDRVAISIYSLGFYLWKMVAPFDLSPLYELPQRIEPTSRPYVEAALALAAVSAGAVLLLRRWWPAVAAAWVSYVVILLPVLGIVQNGWQIAADRYTYLASLGWAMLAGAGVRAWCAAGDPRRLQARRAMALAGTVVVAAVLGSLTWRQARIWHDPGSLWTRAIETYPSATAHYNLAIFLFRQGKTADAAIQYRHALALQPDFAEARNNLGVALLDLGQVAEGFLQFQEALRSRPDSAEVHYNLGLALMKQGQQSEAAEHFRRAHQIRPDLPDVQKNLDRAVAEGSLLRRSVGPSSDSRGAGMW